MRCKCQLAVMTDAWFALTLKGVDVAVVDPVSYAAAYSSLVVV